MFNYLVCNKETRTLSRKKIVRKPPYNRAGCIVEPYNACRWPILSIVGKGRHVYVRARPRPSRSAWAENIANAWLPHMGELQRAITLILRRESKFPKVKSLVSTHSACPCKRYLPKCSPTPQTLINYINCFFSS